MDITALLLKAAVSALVICFYNKISEIPMSNAAEWFIISSTNKNFAKTGAE